MSRKHLSYEPLHAKVTPSLHLKYMYYQIIHIYSNKHPEKSYKWGGVSRQNMGKYSVPNFKCFEGIEYGIMPLFPSLKTEKGQLLE